MREQISMADKLVSKSTFELADGTLSEYYPLSNLSGICNLSEIPFSIRMLIEGALRNCDGFLITEDDVKTLASWKPEMETTEIPFMPSRVILQDFTGVPAVVDLAALRDAMSELGGNSKKVNPKVPVDLVIDHSIQVDYGGLFPDAEKKNLEIEYQRNMERYKFLKWGQKNLDNFRVVPPGRGIVHQINLEWIASVAREEDGVWLPDTLVGTDSHTTMINGLGVLGWGVGGIEAEAVMLGQPIYMLMPEVVGFKLTGELNPGVTATDMTLKIVSMLRKHGVVSKFVEFFGPGLANLSLPDRATIANMAPEYGATCGYFPIDQITLDYLLLSGRDSNNIENVKRYLSAQNLFVEENTQHPRFSSTLELDLSEIVPYLAGPKRPQDIVKLSDMSHHFQESLTTHLGHSGHGLNDSELSNKSLISFEGDAEDFVLKHGDIVIAAITSCTNTSNPNVMLAAGLLARNALQRGLSLKPWVKPSLAPGSRVVTEYYEISGLDKAMSKMGFNVVGYGCTTCIGNSGPLNDEIDNGITENNLIVGSVLSGNRNFEGRVHQKVKANYLASPPLVIAYAIAGNLGFNFEEEPLGHDEDGPIFLRDIWPSNEDIQTVVKSCVKPEMFIDKYSDIMQEPRWDKITSEDSDLYSWEKSSTYIRLPPFFAGINREISPIDGIKNARVLLKLGESITTDHISPAGAFPAAGSAGQYLIQNNVVQRDFNSFGSRRGNHEVMMRGTFANVRIRNQLAPDTEGGFTRFFDTGEIMSVYDAAMEYSERETPLVVLAGGQYGTGSSRDWAAKGTFLLGVKAVIATSYERIHRSNLVGMGVLPLCFKEGENADSLGLDGTESFDIPISDEVTPLQTLNISAVREDGTSIEFETIVRLDTPVEIEYYRNGGILHTVLRKMVEN